MAINDTDICQLMEHAHSNGDTAIIQWCLDALAGDDAAFTACEELINDMYDQTHGYTA